MMSITGDEVLLELAEVVLAESFYDVSVVDTSTIPLLAAEDDNNIAIVTSLVSPARLIEFEPEASRALVRRVTERTIGGKKWDAYVVLLCSESASDDQTEALSMLTQNLRGVRRVVRVGVRPTKADVARALRPLLPLPKPLARDALADPLTTLRERLLADGVDPETVDVAWAAFRVEQAISGKSMSSNESTGDAQ